MLGALREVSLTFAQIHQGYVIANLNDSQTIHKDKETPGQEDGGIHPGPWGGEWDGPGIRPHHHTALIDVLS